MSDATITLLQQLEQRLTEQALAITAKRLDDVVRLSVECADICRQIAPLLPAGDESEQRLRACRNLQQHNTAALTRLNDHCNQFIALLRGSPFAYASHAEVTYPVRRHLLCKL